MAEEEIAAREEENPAGEEENPAQEGEENPVPEGEENPVPEGEENPVPEEEENPAQEEENPVPGEEEENPAGEQEEENPVPEGEENPVPEEEEENPAREKEKAAKGKGKAVAEERNANRIRPEFPNGRVKRIMKLDRDINKINSEALLLVSCSAQLFLEFLAERSAEVATERKRKVVKLEHMRVAVKRHRPTCDFLIDELTVPSQPSDHPATDRSQGRSVVSSSAPAKRDRSRTAADRPAPAGTRRIDGFFHKLAKKSPIQTEEAPIEIDEASIETDDAPIEVDDVPIESDEASIENEEPLIEAHEAPIEIN
ncbi:uncharacterized protein LOC103961505 [Pyrus x bretschneideri]|uniref:uncharacterized protein LOC103961505 n=1 Tax=Pyrus x bretschneideri TaxID=225117 RepID=UPI00202DEB61|nr:uncharacterized protein LOC103961505 [Pyrus x bretschneideri]